MRYPASRVVGLFHAANLLGLSLSAELIFDPQNICQIANSMSTILDDTLYNMGGSAYYYVNKNAPYAKKTANSDSTYILKTSNGYLRSLDLSKDFDATTDDPTVIVGELPYSMPLTKVGQMWSDGGKLYSWGGELEIEEVIQNNQIYNGSRPYPTGTIYEYDILSKKWSPVTLASSSVKVKSPSHASGAYVPSLRTGFTLGGRILRDKISNSAGGSQTGPSETNYRLKSMVNYDIGLRTWKNDTVPSSLEFVKEAALVYVESIGDKGALISMGGMQIITNGAVDNYRDFTNVLIYDLASKIWYSQKTTSETGIFPEARRGFCAVAATAADGSSHNIYVSGGLSPTSTNTMSKTTVDILTLPYFRWISASDGGGATNGHAGSGCHNIASKYMLTYRGRAGNAPNLCDANPGIYFYDLTELSWSTKYVVPKDNKFKVPKKISLVIGGNADGGATKMAPVDGFANGLSRLFSSTTPSPSSSPAPASSSSTGPIVGGVVGGLGVLGLAAGAFFLMRRRKAIKKMDDQSSQENHLMELAIGKPPLYSHEVPDNHYVQAPVEMAAHPPVVHEIDGWASR